MTEKQQDGRAVGETAPKAPKVLSTTLGVVLAANLLAASPLYADNANVGGDHQPKLVEWSSDAVKNYYNPAVDWNIAAPPADGSTGPSPSPSATPSTGGDTVIINEGHGGGFFGGGFGWDDILLYHFLFNSGGMFSAGAWSRSNPVTDMRTRQTYQPRSFSTDTFSNKPVEGSSVRPKTSASSGSFTTKGSGSKSTSSSKGSIGGKSGGFSSSGSSSGGSFGG